MAQRYPYTLELTLASLFIAIILSFPAGVYSGSIPIVGQDRLISVVSLFGLSFPNIALGPILIILVPLSWVGCRFPVLAASSYLVLPAITMADLWPPSSPHGAHVHARRVEPGLHPHRSRQKACPSAPSSTAMPCATQ